MLYPSHNTQRELVTRLGAMRIGVGVSSTILSVLFLLPLDTLENAVIALEGSEFLDKGKMAYE